MTRYVRQDSERSRRRFITAAMGTTVGIGGLSLLSIIGGVRPADTLTPEKTLPARGDVLVYADPTKYGAVVALSDIKEGQVVYAFPRGKGRGTEVVKNGLARNQLIIARFPPAQLRAPADLAGTDQRYGNEKAVRRHFCDNDHKQNFRTYTFRTFEVAKTVSGTSSSLYYQTRC